MSHFRASIVDQSRLFREGLQRLLRSAKFTVLESVRGFEDLSLQSGSDLPDVIVCGLDSASDRELAFDRIFAIRAGSTLPRMVVLKHVLDTKSLSRAAAAKVDAVLSKDISGEVLQRALELVMLGQQVFPAFEPNNTAPLCPELPGAKLPLVSSISIEHEDSPHVTLLNSPIRSNVELPLVSEPGAPDCCTVRLSERENQILRRLAAGDPNKIIARELGIAEGTVKVHVKSLCRKLGVTNRTQAAIRGHLGLGLSALRGPDRGGARRNVDTST